MPAIFVDAGFTNKTSSRVRDRVARSPLVVSSDLLTWSGAVQCSTRHKPLWASGVAQKKPEYKQELQSMHTVSSVTYAQNRKHKTQQPATSRQQPPSTAHTHVHRHQDKAPTRHKCAPGAPTKPAPQPASPPAPHTSSHHGSYEGA